MAETLYTQHRTNVVFHFAVSAQVLTITPTVDDVTQYAGDVIIYDAFGVEVARSPYDYTSDADATADEIVTGILLDITGADVNDYSVLSGTVTVIITCDVGYTAAIDNTGAGGLTAVSTGGASVIGSMPVDAAEWVAAEANTTAKRVACLEFDPTFMRGDAAVPNADMQTRVGEFQVPHHGLPEATGGSMRARLWGTGRAFAAGEQVAGTMLGKLFGNALGGYGRGGDTTVAVVNSPVSVDLTSASHAAVGQIVWVEDADDLGRLWPVQITALSGVVATLDMQLPFTADVADKVYGSEYAYFEQAAINNPCDANYAAPNFLVQKGPHCWAGSVGHVGLSEIAVERGTQPNANFDVMCARAHPPGTTLSPSEPSWTGTVEGAYDVQAIGRDTHIQIQAYGTSTFAQRRLFSAAINPGVPVEQVGGVTEVDDGAPGWIGHQTVPTPTTIEVVVALETADQTSWTVGSLYKLRYFQVGPVGHTWCVHVPKAFLMESPEPVFEGSNRWRLRFQSSDDLTGTTEAAKSKIMLART